MDAIERHFNDVPGADSVFDLIQRELADLKFINSPAAYWLMITGTSDLCLAARLALPDERYRPVTAKHGIDYMYPHLIITPASGRILRVASKENNSRIIACEATHARVLWMPYTAGLPKDRRTHWNVPCEAMIDIYYNPAKEQMRNPD